MPAPLLLDLSHTCHTRARTGIQRVARSLHAALGNSAVPVTHDPYAEAWRLLQPWERANLAAPGPASGRGAHWPWSAQLRGRTRRLFKGSLPLPANSGLIVPEVFSPAVARALPTLFSVAAGPRIALFHDALALQLPELTPAKTVARFPAYLIELLAFDGIAAVSADSRTALVDYWRWLGVSRHPSVVEVSLGLDEVKPRTPPRAKTTDAPVVLSVGTIEGRKNHVALLEACDVLWARGVRFSLHLIGLAHPQTGRAALARLRALQAAGRPLRYDGPVGDDALDAAYAACAFTVYPSLREGFGLPVLESLARGKPCLCSGRGALGESTRAGGGVALENVDAPTLAGAIERLLANPEELAALVAAARKRRFKSWTDYAAELTAWMRELPRRP